MSGTEKWHSVDCCYCMVVGTRAISHTVQCWQYAVRINAPIVFPWFVAAHLVPIFLVAFHFVVAHSDMEVGLTCHNLGLGSCYVWGIGDWELFIVFARVIFCVFVVRVRGDMFSCGYSHDDFCSLTSECVYSLVRVSCFRGRFVQACGFWFTMPVGKFVC